KNLGKNQEFWERFRFPGAPRAALKDRRGLRRDLPCGCSHKTFYIPSAGILNDMLEREKTLTINEIYHSIQGESTWAGWPCVFVRLTFCDLRCNYCDTDYAFYEGN